MSLTRHAACPLVEAVTSSFPCFIVSIRSAIYQQAISEIGEPALKLRFGDQVLHTEGRELQRNGVPSALSPQTFDLLAYLIRHRDRVVTRDELLQAVWAGRIVSDSAFTTAINLARKAIGDSGEAQSMIRTFPRKGVRFIAEAHEEAGQLADKITAGGATAWHSGARDVPEKPSIAVLPFATLGGDPAQDHFADGVVEEITTALARLRSVFVIARNSCFTYKGLAADVRQVSRHLGARYVLEGSVRNDGDRVRITVQVIEGESGNHVWAERYDRPCSDMFALQDEIARRVAAAVEPEIYAAEHLRNRGKPHDALNAWECLVRAMASLGQGTSEGITEAEASCRRAIELVPRFGQAHSLLAWILVRRPFYTGVKGIQEAHELARMALALDERDAWAHLAQGTVHWRERRPEEAERALRRALHLNPNFGLAHAALAMALVIQGQHAAAIASAATALELSLFDPHEDSFASFAIGMALFGAGQYQQAIKVGRDMTDKWPAYLPAHLLLVVATMMDGGKVAAEPAIGDLLNRNPKISMKWLEKNTSFSGELGDRYLGALRAAGIPVESAK